MSKKFMLFTVCLLAVTNVASAAVNVPDGVAGLWLFPNGTPEQAAIGNDAAFVYDNAGSFTGTAVQIGTESSPLLYQDSGNAQISTWGAVDLTHGIAPNGGGTTRVNEYTWLIDYKQNGSPEYASLFDTTDGDAHDGSNSDGELFVRASGIIGSGDTGYSTLTYDSQVPHRIVVSADLGDFFRVYIDGALFLDSTTTDITDPSAIDGRFSLPETFHLLVDNAWEGEWGLLETAMIWDHALTTAEVAGLGSFADANNGGFPTPLIMANPVPEPTTLVLFGLGLSGMLTLRRRK